MGNTAPSGNTGHDAVPDTGGTPGLDLDRFAGWFSGARPGEIGGPLSGRLLAGGKSNLTYEVSDGTRAWVVRRPPLGHVLATAHDMRREYQVISALRDTGVPVGHAVRPVRGHRRAGGAVLRDVAGGRDGLPDRRADGRGRAGPHAGHRRANGRHAGRVALRRLPGGRAGVVRAAGGVPGPAGPAMEEAAGRIAQPGDRRDRRAARPAGGQSSRRRAGRGRARRLPAGQPAGRRGTTRSPPSWTGRWPPSRTR